MVAAGSHSRLVHELFDGSMKLHGAKSDNDDNTMGSHSQPPATQHDEPKMSISNPLNHDLYMGVF